MMYYGDTVHMWIFLGVGRKCGNFNIHVYLGHKVFNSTHSLKNYLACISAGQSFRLGRKQLRQTIFISLFLKFLCLDLIL